MLTLENKLKKVAVCAAVDITLRGNERSPERCERNLAELGASVAGAMKKEQKEKAYRQLLEACRKASFLECRSLFSALFLEQR